MRAKIIKKYIESLTSHITFDYNNKPCGVDPFSRNNFDIWYGDNVITATSIDEVMTIPIFDGKSLNEIADIIVIEEQIF